MKYMVHRVDTDAIEVDVRLGDKLRAEREMIARGWGSPADAPQSWLTIAIFRAALREGLDVPDNFDDFVDSVEKTTPVEVEAVPFDGAHTTGS